MISSVGPAHVLALPFAGGNEYAYRPLSAALSSRVGLTCLALPGRGRRFGETLVRNLDALARACADEAATIARAQPYILFGHSMGAWLALRLAYQLTGAGLPSPRAIVVSGAGAPTRYEARRRHELPRDAFLAELERMGGCPVEFLRDPALLEVFLPLLYADFQVVETYRHDGSPPLSCPITVLRGLSDPDVGEEWAAAWKKMTTAETELISLSGGHFFLFDHVAVVADVVEAAACGTRRSVAQTS